MFCSVLHHSSRLAGLGGELSYVLGAAPTRTVEFSEVPDSAVYQIQGRTPSGLPGMARRVFFREKERKYTQMEW